MLFLFFQILENLWNICNCGPYHMLLEIQYCRRRKIPITVGVRKLREAEGWRAKEKNWKEGLRCRR